MENETKEIIAEQQISKALVSLDKTAQEHSEQLDKVSINMPKVKEIVKTFEGCTVGELSTIVTVAELLLPLATLITVHESTKETIKTKMLIALAEKLTNK